MTKEPVPSQSLTMSGSEQEEDREIKIGEKFSLRSDILDEDRPYWVYLPASYDDSTYAPQRYPVLYLLDGAAHFHSASGIVSYMGDCLSIPELIVVAILNTDRVRDLTPTHSTVDIDGEEYADLESSGGGDAFLQFIRDELFPKVDATYRTLPYRVLVGHSIGGLMGLHALLSVPEMFQGYIVIDPSLWWDNEVTVHRAESELECEQERQSAVYISMANHPVMPDVNPELMDRPIRKFAEMLKAVSCRGTRSMLQHYDKENHGSVPLLSLYHGLQHIFEGYKPRPEEFVDQPTVLNDHFARVSERLGLDLLPPEKHVDGNGLFFLNQRDDVDKALEFLQLNVANYPGSYNVYDSLAAAYAAKGEKDLAIEHYEKSLALNPDNKNAVEKLEELRGEEPKDEEPQDG